MLVVKIIAVIAAVFAAVVLAAFLGQRRLMYFPDRVRTPPAAAGLVNVTEHEIAAPDGTYVVTWWGRAQPGQPTLLYFHGNAASLAARAPRVERSMQEGWGFAIMTYRGFGGSTGTPSEVHNVADALRTFDWLVVQGVPPASIVVYGESLGTGPFLPVEWAMLDRYDTKAQIRGVTCPILIFHGTLDQVIPVAMGREIARIAPEPKLFIELPKAGHIDIYINGNDAFTPLRAWINGLGRWSNRSWPKQ
jgi:uncharacterized protein